MPIHEFAYSYDWYKIRILIRMAGSFFEKLKRGMGIETQPEEVKEEVNEKPKAIREKKSSKENLRLPTGQAKKIEAKPEEKTPLTKPPENIPPKKEEEKEWLKAEGELAVDVYQTEEEIVIQSTIAGVKPENLDISIENDVVTIRGNREKPEEKTERDYFYQECYWGPFSREIILPAETDPSRATAEMKEGILTIRIPKIQKEKKRKIIIKG